MNFIFKRNRPIRDLYVRSCDLGLMTLTMDRIANIFGRRVTRRIKGKLETVLERMDEGHHVLRGYFKRSFVKQYEKWRTFLRLEVVSNDVKDLGLKRKGLHGLSELQTKMKEAVGRFAEGVAVNLNNGGQYDLLGTLARPVTQGRTKVAGIRIESARIARLLGLLLRGAPGNLRGWRSSELYEVALKAYEIAKSDYTINQLRYDLRKLKQHGIVERIAGTHCYRLTNRGAREEDGVFEIEGTVDGQEVELDVKADGEIVKLEVERDEEDDLPLSFEDLPAAVQEVLLAKFPGLEITEIEREEDGVFEIEGTVDGQEVELDVKADGEIVKLEVERDEEDEEQTRTTISLDEVPAGVLAKLEEVAPGLEIRKVQLDVHAEDEQVYIFKGELRGPSVKIEISAEGEVVHAGKGPEDDDLDPLNGCTRGVGYWKNHLDDPAWDVLGPDVAFFQSGQNYAEMLHTPARGDAYVILARTYISALLNEENGAVPAAGIEAMMELAETWFETAASSRPVPPSTEDGRMAVALAELLDSFNRGLLGASHCEGESDAPGEGDEPGEEDEGEENENHGNSGGEEPDEPGEGSVVVEVTPLEVALKDLPEQARAVGLSGALQLKIATGVGFHYRFECLNAAERWQPLGGKFRGDGEEKVVRVPVGQAAHCSLFRVKITPIAQAEGGAGAGTEGEDPPVEDDELAGGGGS